MSKKVVLSLTAIVLSALVGCNDSPKKPETEVVAPPPGIKSPKMDKPGKPGQPVIPSVPQAKKGSD